MTKGGFELAPLRGKSSWTGMKFIACAFVAKDRFSRGLPELNGGFAARHSEKDQM